MVYNQNRLSSMSGMSHASRQNTLQSNQTSTRTLLNALHNAYLNNQAYSLESNTSLVVNTWSTALHIAPDGRTGGTIDQALAERAWQHARRRLEDETIILG
jgi:chitin synthase